MARATLRCDRCGAKRSRFSTHSYCLACARFLPLDPPPLDLSDQTAVDLYTRGLPVGELLSDYRHHRHMSQSALANEMGVSQSTISRYEAGRDFKRDDLLRIARLLGQPPEMLGVTASYESSTTENIQFLASITTLARTARAAGNPAAAYRELREVVRHLQSLSVSHTLDADSRLVAAEAQFVLGLVEGELLPGHALGRAVRRLETAVQFADAAELEPTARGYIDAYLGNHLRMAGDNLEALEHLALALDTAPTSVERGTYSAFIARAAGEAQLADKFRGAIRQARQALDDSVERTAIFSETAISEIEARGLLRLDRPRDAIYVLDKQDADVGAAVTPQWRLISSITRAEAELAIDEPAQACDDLELALSNAIQLQMPHQIERIYKLLGELRDPRANHLKRRATDQLAEADIRLVTNRMST